MMRKLLLLVLVFVAFVSAADAATCVRAREALIETGISPSGAPWTVKAKKSSNGGRCNEWLFQVKFKLPNVVAHAAGTTIPVGGHIPKDFRIIALDAEGLDGVERAFSGFTGSETARVVAVLEDGSVTEIVAKSPSKQLRQKYVWMRGFRYFVHYYPAGVGVRSIKLLSKSGNVLYRAQAEPGGSFL